MFVFWSTSIFSLPNSINLLNLNRSDILLPYTCLEALCLNPDRCGSPELEITAVTWRANIFQLTRSIPRFSTFYSSLLFSRRLLAAKLSFFKVIFCVGSIFSCSLLLSIHAITLFYLHFSTLCLSFPILAVVLSFEPCTSCGRNQFKIVSSPI